MSNRLYQNTATYILFIGAVLVLCDKVFTVGGGAFSICVTPA